MCAVQDIIVVGRTERSGLLVLDYLKYYTNALNTNLWHVLGYTYL
jgi:hypothetical protein